MNRFLEMVLKCRLVGTSHAKLGVRTSEIPFVPSPSDEPTLKSLNIHLFKLKPYHIFDPA